MSYAAAWYEKTNFTFSDAIAMVRCEIYLSHSRLTESVTKINLAYSTTAIRALLPLIMYKVELRLLDVRGCRPPSSGRCPLRCRSGSLTAMRAPATPVSCASRHRRIADGFAKLWRIAWGVAVAGRPSCMRAMAITPWIARGFSAPPRTPRTKALWRLRVRTKSQVASLPIGQRELLERSALVALAHYAQNLGQRGVHSG